MHSYQNAHQMAEILESCKKVVIVQADNPDADSLGSALALETILGDRGYETYLYCGVTIPSYLHYLPGWDRVIPELPASFDASIIVDASTTTLLEKLLNSPQKNRLKQKPCIVLDHHESVQFPIDFATVRIIDGTRASTGELIALIGNQLSWTVSKTAKEYLMTSILGDTQGLTNQLTTATTYQQMADFVASGVDRPALEESRREANRMPASIYRYKAQLIDHTVFASDSRLAYVVVPQAEINSYSPLYNPGPLIQGDMLQIVGVQVVAVLKSYDDGKITAAIRCNAGYGIAAALASHFDGGGHAYASGFKIYGRDLDSLLVEFEALTTELLDIQGTTAKSSTI